MICRRIIYPTEILALRDVVFITTYNYIKNLKYCNYESLLYTALEILEVVFQIFRNNNLFIERDIIRQPEPEGCPPVPASVCYSKYSLAALKSPIS